MTIQEIPIAKLKSNTGQIDGLPANPRVIRDEKFQKLVKSIQDDPEMLELRELIVVPSGKIFVVIAGNMRLRAMESLGYKEAPCKVLDADTPVEKLKAYTIKDNVGFGEHDWDQLANEWDMESLEEWGVSKELSALKKTYDMLNGKFDGKKMDYPVTIILDAEEFRMWKKMKEKIGKKTDNEAFFALSNAYFDALLKESK